MNLNEQDMFDKLVKQKLDGYSEEPDMQLLQHIHSKKNRVLKLYGLYRLLIITAAIGLGLLGAYYLGMFDNTQTIEANILRQADKTTLVQPDVHNNDYNAEPIDSEWSGEVERTDKTTNINEDLTLNTNDNGNNNTTQKLQQNNNSASEHKLLQKQQRQFVSDRKINDNPTTRTDKAKEVTKPINTDKKNNNGNQSHSSDVLKQHNASEDEIKTEDILPESALEESSETSSKKEENVDNVCKALFDYYVSYNGEVTFSNMSSASNTAYYEWQFGDGERTTQAEPSHLYKKDGRYVVSLTVTDATTGCSQSLQKTIVLGDEKKDEKQLTQIVGTVKAGSQLVAYARVDALVLPQGSDEYEMYMSTTNINGEFVVSNVKAGRYWIVAHPTEDTKGYLKTYWGNETELLSAPEIVVISEYDGTLKGYSIDLVYEGTVTAVETGVTPSTNAGQLVVLVDANDNIVGQARVDDNGNVHYDGDELSGNFKVVNPQTGEVSGSVSFNNDRTAPIADEGRNSSAPVATAAISLAPNPAAESVNVGLTLTSAHEATIIVMNTNGSELLRTRQHVGTGYNTVPVDISRISTGIYYVMVILDNGQVITSRLMKQYTGSSSSGGGER